MIHRDQGFARLAAEMLRRYKHRVIGRCEACRSIVRSDQKHIRVHGALYHSPSCARYVRR